jgi:hypothetical protein
MNRTSSSADQAAPSGSGATSEPGLRRKVAVALFLWAFPYACYRAYYAAGGDFGMIGQPVSMTQIRAINAAGAAVIGVAAILPPIAMRVRVLRHAMPALGWIGAVGCCMHALVDWTSRVLSLTGVQPDTTSRTRVAIIRPALFSYRLTAPTATAPTPPKLATNDRIPAPGGVVTDRFRRGTGCWPCS